MHVREAKSQLRQFIAERLAKMTPKERTAESRSLCRRLLEALPKDHCVIAAYFPLKTEADIRPLLKTLLDQRCDLYLPCFKSGTCIFRKTKTLLALPLGPLNIPEPPEDAEELDPKELDYALIPARAFDHKGNRLGRGNGGFDRWIRTQRSLHPTTKIFGIAFDCQIMNEIPTEAHDEKVDGVITARGMIYANDQCSMINFQ